MPRAILNTSTVKRLNRLLVGSTRIEQAGIFFLWKRSQNANLFRVVDQACLYVASTRKIRESNTCDEIQDVCKLHVLKKVGVYARHRT